MTTAHHWHEVELTFAATGHYANPYTDLTFHADFRGPGGQILRRPGFWDGGSSWKVRFASPIPEGEWHYTTHSAPLDSGLHGLTGILHAAPAPAKPHPLLRHGLLRMSPGGRNVIHADGHPLLLVADTAWALPYRATEETATIYARDRQAKGYSAALLMTVQPDMQARGPRSRTAPEGFDVGFEDLPQGRLQQPNPAYFQHYDRLLTILLDHGIVPIHQPVFHGFGWKGQKVAGLAVSPEDYARYCRYLVARYGARPALWLVGADGTGREPNVAPAGREIELCDCYQQPTGIHYNPCADNAAYQAEPWLDFQLCQTGHNNEHRPEMVAEMYMTQPTRAVACGEPTYEGMGAGRFGRDWWQGHEAWTQLLSGGTMGVFYGAASLWQWRLTADEPGWGDWCAAPASWRDALSFEGSTYPGHVAKVFAGLPFADMRKDIVLSRGRLCVSVPGKFGVIYLPEGGSCTLNVGDRPWRYRLFDPQQGIWLDEGVATPGPDTAWGFMITTPHGAPRVILATPA